MPGAFGVGEPVREPGAGQAAAYDALTLVRAARRRALHGVRHAPRPPRRRDPLPKAVVDELARRGHDLEHRDG